LSLFGPLSGSVFTDDATVGTIAWTSTANVAVRDKTYANAAMNVGDVSHYLLATGFGFAIPTQVTVIGVVAELLRTGTTNQLIVDSSIRLVVGGVVVGNERAVPTDQWASLTQRYRRYGGAVDLWGVPWLLSADVSATGFGIAVSATDTFDEGFGATAQLDHIQMTVYGAGM